VRIDELSWTETRGWSRRNAGIKRNGDAQIHQLHNGRPRTGNGSARKTDLVLYFGTRETLANAARYDELHTMFPDGHVVGCSTGGQIHNDDISDGEISAAALSFDATAIRLAREPADAPDQSRKCGAAIGKTLAASDLAGIFILSDGLNVNGSELVAGITSVVGQHVPVTGGLAGDGAQFKETLVGADCPPRKHLVAAIGFYGQAIRIGHGSAGGWDEFGPRRRITRSAGHVLYELDGSPALDLYERYLGEEEAKGLPGTALLFPLRIYDPQRPEHDLVRTVLAVDRITRSMTFAGDMPEGWVAQLMRGNFDRLAAGAADAARQASSAIAKNFEGDGLAVLVSCIGRRLLMGQRTTDEVEAVSAEFGPRMTRLGFYSYGEISPHAVSGVCELHNQTMTVTAITEVTG
jgi:hypothetical protein